MRWIALALALASTASADSRVLDRVVAVVGSEIIPLSELELESRIELVRAGGTLAATASIDHESLEANLTKAIANRLALAEADRLGSYAVDGAALDAEITKFRQALQPLALEQFLAINEISMGEFQRILRRDLVSAKYLDARSQLRSPITDAEVDAAIAASPVAKKTQVSPQMREQVRKALGDQRRTQLALDEVRRLYARTKVRIVDPSFSKADEALRPTNLQLGR